MKIQREDERGMYRAMRDASAITWDETNTPGQLIDGHTASQTWDYILDVCSIVKI
jgi:hypothetical protein